MWAGMKGITGQQAGEADTGIIATLRAQNGKMVSSSKGKREEALVEHYRNLGTPTDSQRSVRRRIRERNQRVGKGERRWVRQKGETVVQTGYRASSQEKKQENV